MRSASSSTRTTAAARAASSRKILRRCCFSAGRNWSARWESRAASRGCPPRNPTSISQLGPWGAVYRPSSRRKASRRRAGRRSKQRLKRPPSAGATRRPARRTGAATVSSRNESNSGRAAKTACTTACVTGRWEGPGKSNGWRPEGQPAGSWGGDGLEAPPGPGKTSFRRARSARGYDHLLLEFRGCVAGRECAQAVVLFFPGNLVTPLEFRRRIGGRQIAQAAVERLAGNPVAPLEFHRRIGGRQIAQAAVERFAQHLEGIVHEIGCRICADRSRREKHRDHRNQSQNFACAHCSLLRSCRLFLRGVVGATRSLLTASPTQHPPSVFCTPTYQQDRCQGGCDFLPPPSTEPYRRLIRLARNGPIVEQPLELRVRRP